MLDPSLFFIFGISIAIFLSVLLFIQPRRVLAGTILSAWLLVIALHITVYVLARTNDVELLIRLIYFAVLLPMVEGIFLYAYTAALTNQMPKRKSAWLLHLIVPLSFLAWMIPFFLLPKEQQIMVFHNKGAGYEVFLLTERIAVVALMLGYMLWAHVLLRRHRRNILNEFSNTDKITLNWLQYLIYGFGIVFLAVLYQGGNAIIYTAVTAMVLFIGFFGIRQGGILTTSIHAASSLAAQRENTPQEQHSEEHIAENPIAENISTPPTTQDLVNLAEDSSLKAASTLAENSEEKKKYAKSGLTAAMGAEYHTKLHQAMHVRKLFTNNELTLSNLADELGILPNYLSQIINEREGKTFYDYVNELRIEEFKRCVALPDNHNLTLLAVAFDCGFNSKSSFNRCFKKMMDCSPSEYVNKQRASG